MHSMCKTFTGVGPLALTSSAGILSKPGALSECRSLIALSTSDSSGNGSLSTSLNQWSASHSHCHSFEKLFSIYLPSAKDFSWMGECSACPAVYCHLLRSKSIVFTFLLGQTSSLTS